MEGQAQTEEMPIVEPTPTPAPVVSGRVPGAEVQARRIAREEKGRKKDDKSVEHVLRSLNTLSSPEEKLAAMCKKFAEVMDDNRKLQMSVKQVEKRLGILQREKEQLQTEHSKAVLTRSRLESLCRELQRQNKAIKDESLLKIREEEEKRKEVSNKFQSTLADITTLMQQNNEKNSKLREDNLEMTKKFKSLCEQYEMREQQVEKMTRQMQLESQLSDAKLAKAQLEIAAEKEALLREKQQILLELQEYQTKCQDLQVTEASLRGQISLYTDKYDEFQNALTRSNEVFGGFKGEMDKMSKKVGKLQKEALMWKSRWEKSHQTLLEMAEDKQKQDAELAQTSRKLVQLQKLCRTMQAERTALHSQLRASDLKGQQGDGGASLTSELQSVCDRLTETLGGLQLSDGGLDQAECPSKIRAKARSLTTEAAAQVPQTASPCGYAEDVGKARVCDGLAVVAPLPPDIVGPGPDVAGGPDESISKEVVGGELPSENMGPNTESEVGATVLAGSVEGAAFGADCAPADENCNACTLTMPLLDCAIPSEEIIPATEPLPTTGAQPPPCCSEGTGRVPDADVSPQEPSEAAGLDEALAEKTDGSDGCTSISGEILFKPIANGHAILLPEENLPVVTQTHHEAKKGKDAGKKRKK